MLSFLKSTFGSDITESEYIFPDNIPYYIRDSYSLRLLKWGENECVLLEAKDSSLRLPALKKHLKKFHELTGVQCALGLSNLSALQRKSLIEDKIPFLSLAQQVYLPFWGCVFSEKFKTETPRRDKMAPGTQLVFLYLYYSESQEPLNLTGLTKCLSLSKATCTRAVEDLSSSGLIDVKTEGTNKWIKRAYEKQEFLRKGYDRMKSPVERLLYLKKSLQLENQVIGGIRALAAESMIGVDNEDGSFAVSRDDAKKIPEDIICTKEYFKDFGGSLIEVWSYDPASFARNNVVDDISLLLSLDRDSDERVQKALDVIRKKYGLLMAK